MGLEVNEEYIIVADRNGDVIFTTQDIDELKKQAHICTDAGGEISLFKRIDIKQEMMDRLIVANSNEQC